MMKNRFIAVIEYDPKTKLYIGIVPGLTGAHTQAKSLDELRKNLKEVIELCLEEIDDKDRKSLPDFIGTQEIEVNKWAEYR
ncbi:MAG: type II toxin-antitoxin system HicB family antitoxin [Elusimicrobiales bacterium]|nr:type II toxin-antitoxin system HicB family antitoxin [Elusimicrobiales bacterium]